MNRPICMSERCAQIIGKSHGFREMRLPMTLNGAIDIALPGFQRPRMGPHRRVVGQTESIDKAHQAKKQKGPRSLNGPSDNAVGCRRKTWVGQYR
jgi:hypothetical protein